ncbi:MAG: hypothetical protein ACSHX3_12535 [Litorimonas sp.]
MIKLARLSASSLALMIALLAGSANGQDNSFDVEATDPAVEAVLEAKELALDEFFDDASSSLIVPEAYTPDADLNARQESALLDRAEREMTEFNDIDDDDLAELDRKVATDANPRLEKPGQVETDFAAICPLGTETQADGTCLAGPDWRFED